MTEEPVRQGVTDDPSLDNDSQDDPSKGAAIGGIGGAVAGAVAGSMAGPVGTLAGAVIGGIVGAVTSKAAVGAIDKIEHENVAPAHGAPPAALPIDTVASPEIIGDPATNPRVIPIPLPDGASTSYKTVDETPDTASEPEKTY